MTAIINSSRRKLMLCNIRQNILCDKITEHGVRSTGTVSECTRSTQNSARWPSGVTSVHRFFLSVISQKEKAAVSGNTTENEFNSNLRRGPDRRNYCNWKRIRKVLNATSISFEFFFLLISNNAIWDGGSTAPAKLLIPHRKQNYLKH